MAITGPRAGRSAVALLATTLVVALAVGAAAWGAGHPSARRAADSRSGASALLAYEKALSPVVKDWGSIEILGMRPAIADLQNGGPLGRPDIVATQARAWQAALRADRRKLLALQPPEPVRPAGQLFDRAIMLYIDAASTFLAASEGERVQVQSRVRTGIALARRGAQIYNQASAVLQRARRAYGMPPTADFPDPR